MAGGETDEITCQQLVELVTDYLEAVLPEPERTRLEAHLAECPYCEEYIAQMRQTIDAVGELSLEVISRERQEQLLEAFRGWRRAGSIGRNARGTPGT
jgi:anti-sigma factor RsiW